MAKRLGSDGRLFLIPTPLAPYSPRAWEPQRLRDMIAPHILERLRHISLYVVESEKSAIRFLSRLLPQESFDRIRMVLLDEHSTARDLEAPLAALKEGTDCAILSEAGMPCIADPGAALVTAAHRENIRVVPLGTDSSLLLALAASGLNGQQFSFLGYLPVQDDTLRRKLASEGITALRDGAARIFIETPYRNARVLEACKESLPEKLHLCCAAGLGTEEPTVISMPVSMWRSNDSATPQEPAVFCFGLPAMLEEKNARLQPPRSRRT
jgi:Predicted methyltransferases